MSWIIVTISGVLLGLAYLASRQLSLTKFHPITLTYTYSVLGAIFALPFLFYEFQLAESSHIWLIILISPLVFAFANYAGFIAYKTTEASVVNLLGKINLIVASFLAYFVLKESLTSVSIFGLVLILSGSIALMYENKKINITRGMFYAIIMSVGFGVVAVLDRIVLREMSPFTYVFINNLIIAIALSVFSKPRKEIFHLLRSQPKWTILSALLGLLSWVNFLFAIRLNDLAKLYPSWESIALLTTVIVGYAFFDERSRMLQKTFGIVLTILGIFILSS